MEQREPLSPENDRLWRALWELWQANDEEDVILDTPRIEELEEEVPTLTGRIRTSLAYLQRARYIQYSSGVGGEGIEPILYDVYEPEDGG